MEAVLLTLVSLVSLLLTAQATHTLYLMIYTWDQPAAEELALVPEDRAAAATTFTVIVPARHEEDVIQVTIDRAAYADYPVRLVQIIVVCSAGPTNASRAKYGLQADRFDHCGGDADTGAARTATELNRTAVERSR